MTLITPKNPYIIYNRRGKTPDDSLEWDGMAGYYDEDDIPQLIADYGEENWQVQELRRDGNCFDEDESQFEWEYLMDEITEWMKEVTPKEAWANHWQGYVMNFGWRSLSGEKEFTAEDGQKFLREVLPDTDNYFKIYKCEDATGRTGLAIQNWHHDSPMGNEWYFVFALIETEDEEEENENS